MTDEELTDEELVKRLRNAKATQDFRHTLEDEAADRIEALLNLNEALVELMDDRDAKLAKAVEAAVDAGASLAAAISLLERGGRKAAPSNKMFDQMLVDYRNSLERTRTTLAEIEGGTT